MQDDYTVNYTIDTEIISNNQSKFVLFIYLFI